MTGAEVIRTDTEHLRVRGKWFDARACVDLEYERAKAEHPDNPAFWMRPMFCTGSGYADAILALGADEVTEPAVWSAMFVGAPQNAPGTAPIQPGYNP